MVWRAAYQTSVAYDLAVPEISLPFGELPSFNILLGGFDFECLSEIAVWQRLIAADEPEIQCSVIIFGESWSAADKDLLRVSVPKSMWRYTLLALDEDRAWRKAIEPQYVGQAFAAALTGRTMKIAMKGLPTEEAWDEFRSCLGG